MSAPDPFAKMPIDSFITFETCETAMDIEIIITDDREFPGSVHGTAATRHSERSMTREQISRHRAGASRAKRMIKT